MTLRISRRLFANATTAARKKKYFPMNSTALTPAADAENPLISLNARSQEKAKAYPRVNVAWLAEFCTLDDVLQQQ
jgi:hypothetical protein